MAPVVLPVSPMPATAMTATAHGVSAMPPWLPVGDHKCQRLRSAPVVLCHAMPCRAMPFRAAPAARSARAEGCARLCLLPGRSGVSLPVPLPSQAD